MARERFVREAQSLSKLHHPNVVVLHNFGATDDDSLFLGMEEVHGAALRAPCAPGAAMGARRAVRVGNRAWVGRLPSQRGRAKQTSSRSDVMVVQPPRAPEQVKLLDFGPARPRSPSRPLS